MFSVPRPPVGIKVLAQNHRVLQWVTGRDMQTPVQGETTLKNLSYTFAGKRFHGR